MGLSDFFKDLGEAKMMGLLGDSKDNKNDGNDEELDSLGLDDWQKDEVRKGNYSPWSFEEDGEQEEDDYYYEDE